MLFFNVFFTITCKFKHMKVVPPSIFNVPIPLITMYQLSYNTRVNLYNGFYYFFGNLSNLIITGYVHIFCSDKSAGKCKFSIDSILCIIKLKEMATICLIVYRGFIACRTSEFYLTHIHTDYDN